MTTFGSDKWRPHNLTLDPSRKTIVDNMVASPLDFTYKILSIWMVSKRPYISEWAEDTSQRLWPGLIQTATRYHQKLSGLVDSRSFTETTFIEANFYWRQRMCHLTSSFLSVRHWVPNVTVRNGGRRYWSHMHHRPYTRTTCHAEEERNNIQTASLKKILPLEVGKGEAIGSGPEVRRPYRLRLLGAPILELLHQHCDVKEPTVEAPPTPKRKKMVGPEKIMAYKYPRT